jgi:hypothetical protein
MTDAMCIAVPFAIGALMFAIDIWTSRPASGTPSAARPAPRTDPYRTVPTPPSPEPVNPPLILDFYWSGRSFTCPKCTSQRRVCNIPKYCKCSQCGGGHFHVVCSGGERGGCGAQWIMRAAYVKSE